MKHLSFVYNDTKALQKALKEAEKKKYTSQLIQLFTGITNKTKIQKIITKLKQKFPDALIIGATTAGEISHAKMYEDRTFVNLTLFKSTKIKAHYVPNIDAKSGKKLSKKISTKETKAAIILSEGLLGEDYEGFIDAFKEQNEDIITSGGLAGDNFKLKKTYIFLNDTIYTHGAVALSLSGKDLFADNHYNLNWSPIGKEFTISSSDGNIVHTINGESAVSLFKKYLGADIFKNNATALPSFQLLYKEGDTVVSRTPMSFEGNSIIFAGALKEGTKVQFGFSNASTIITHANTISQKISTKPAQAIFIYSCVARKTLLGKTLENEFAPFEEVAPSSGFFTYGEFYSTHSSNTMLNSTTTILVLSEKSTLSKKKNTLNKSTKPQLEDITFEALTHFVKQTSDELNSNTLLLNQYKDVVDKSSLVSKTDINGTITFVNDNFCKVSKYSREELLGQNHRIVRSPEVKDFVFKKMWKSITEGRIWKGVLPNRAKDGSTYYVDITIMPIINKQNEIEEYIAIRQNITKQVQSKRRIQEKERLIKAIFDNQDSIVIYASSSKGMLSVNKKLFDYLDYKNFEDFKSKNKCICDNFLKVEGYIHPDTDPNWLNDIAMDESNTTHKVKMRVKDGSVHTFNLIIKKINDEYIINLYDITTLEEALTKAHSSEQAKSIFLANMSHEIRTPLNGILGFTDILSKKDLDKDSMRYIKIIHKSGQTLLNVVNDILDFSKIESGELSLYETDSDLFSEMEAAVSTFASVSRQKHIDYYTYIDTNIPMLLKCDVQRVKQVLNNLISNAIKFTPEHGQVNVSITLQSVQNNRANIHFSVKDSGIGIAKEKLPTVFKAFSQADDSISREFGGTGLGLAISSQYIEMMHSNLQVKSEEGKGSEFYFELQLPIVNNSLSINKEISDTSQIHIAILNAPDTINCTINDIVISYLDAWKFSYTTVDSIEDVDESVDFIIVCAKIFDKKSCEDVLNTHQKLKLLYIEGSEENFSCSHEKFYLLEQPMTGSALFDKIVTLSNEDLLSSSQNEQLPQQSGTQFQGNILVAEDNETNQMLISIMLEERGLGYKIVSNGQEAVDEAMHSEYDIIFMDINMPIMDGITATKLLREKGYSRSIVSLSANVIEDDIVSFKEAGVNDSLHKPIVPRELDAILRKYTQNNIVVDSVNLQAISKALSIANEKIVLKLLQSFLSSAQKILQKLQSDGLNEDITHTLKGTAGNLRFNRLYTLAVEFEKNLQEMGEEEREKATELLSFHLKSLIEQIESLDK